MNIIDFFRSLFQAPPPRPDNTGIILGPHNGASDPNVYVAGAASPIVYENRLNTGNWLSFTWSKIKQWCLNNGQYVDQLSCTTNAIITSIETQEFFLTGKQTRYSRRWVAKMSGTNQGALKGVGNYMDAPAEWIRKNGLVLETSYPTPDSYTQDEFYADIPTAKSTDLLNEGKAWLTRFDFKYEFLQVTDPNLDYHLKHAPITVVIPGHDICGIYSPDQLMQYRDSYEPWDKSVPVTGLQAALKGILTDKRIVMRKIGWQDAEKGVYVGFDTPARQASFVAAMQTLFTDYRLDDKEWNLGKRPW